ncbi:MAG TPA: glycoside hydrolase family 2 TIM barrel-domain containing protein [Edaphobacter sp.]|jgi:beta-galactosidase|nr:glycoside hydrolase family 2 TIM barrel-domain containing protein [Edaphobacter sp.]
MRRLSRRTFLQSATAATLAAKLNPASAQSPKPAEIPYPENGTLIPDDDWRLWVDEKAEWKNDPLFLPEDISWQNDVLCGKGSPLPVNEPTGGWGTLRANNGINVTLPTTVEQHHWGKFGTRPYSPEEYRYAADDPIPQNGAYLGVSWWGKQIHIPAEWKGKRIFLHIRGARLRAEVFLNKKLVGYSIMEELPFECDLTQAADPGGFNLMAIRLTNPFGRYDWVDGLNAQWGAVKLYRSHGFAGLDRGMTISACEGPLRIKDMWALNKPDGTIKGFIALDGDVAANTEHGLSFSYVVLDPSDGKQLQKHLISLPKGSPALKQIVEFDVPREAGLFWDLENPKLYHLRVELNDSRQTAFAIADSRTIAFGFRSFTPTGIDTNAVFRLNNRRIKLYSSISWGFWGLNGLFPTPELAEKEVTQAKKLNLNCLNFHRNLAKEEVLRNHDRLGLLRYMEPGAGKMAIGKLPANTAASANSIVMEKPTDDADKFAQHFMQVKCVEMVKAYRSHPSVIIYCLQNEIGADLKNPDTIAILEAMRAEDPSRCIVLNDGFVAPPRKAAQAWFEPWNDKIHRSDEKEWGDWWNQHQGAGDQWYDEFYKSPTDFTYQAPFKNVLTEFGEMEGCATPDNHALMVHQITETYLMYGGNSYDLVDHKEILAAYDAFLDKWKFRSAFPTAEHLFNALGKKCYDTWQNYLENARISDELDFAVISGWETTAIENHSGIVDNLRNFKSDPTPISGTLTPIRPVAKQRSASTARGGSATFDLFLLNDTPQPVTGNLSFTAVTPSGKLLKLAEMPPPKHIEDQFSYLLLKGFQTPPLTEEGLYRFKFSLSSAPLSTQTKEIWVTEPPAYKRARALNIAVSGITPALHKQLADLTPRLGLEVEDFTAGKKYDVIITSGLTAHTSATQNSGDTTGLENQPGHEVGAVPTTTEVGHIDPAILEAVRAGSSLLAIPQADTLSEGVAKQLAAAGAFTYSGTVGDYRAPWMGNWYFVRQHPIYSGLPTNQVMGIHYQAKGRQANGLLVDGHNLEIIAAYSRDHDRNIGAGTFTAKLDNTKIIYHRVPDMHPVLQQRFLANAIAWLTTESISGNWRG